MNQIPNIEETHNTREVEEIVAQLLLRTYDRCFVRGRVPPEVGSSIAHYDLFLKEELTNLLHQQLQKARYCGKEFADGSICRVKLDCHLHDWRQREEIQKARQDWLRSEIEKLEGVKTNYVQGMENGLLHHREPCQCQTCVDKRNDTLTSIITRYKKELKVLTGE